MQGTGWKPVLPMQRKADDEANEKNCLSDELRTLKTRTFQDTKGKTKDRLCQQDVLPTLS